MKSYTDIEQSKALSRILPIESADMMWKKELKYRICNNGYKVSESDFIYYPTFKVIYYPTFKEEQIIIPNFDVPAWSLAALLDVLPFHLIVNNDSYAFSMIKGLDKNGETYAIKYAIFNTTFYLHLTDFYNNPVDACVAMIEKLHELKML